MILSRSENLVRFLHGEKYNVSTLSRYNTPLSITLLFTHSLKTEKKNVYQILKYELLLEFLANTWKYISLSILLLNMIILI